jgi:uncharacterized damage-inducible protein DinB
MGFNKWKILILDGEFAERKKILEDLTADEVNKKPAAGMHSIYEELWHAELWMRIVREPNDEIDKLWDAGERYPASPATQAEWDSKVKEFLGGLDKMMEFTANPENLKKEEEPGVTTEDYVYPLIMHNTYHLAKIVAVRQMIGAWPPKKSK